MLHTESSPRIRSCLAQITEWEYIPPSRFSLTLHKSCPNRQQMRQQQNYFSSLLLQCCNNVPVTVREPCCRTWCVFGEEHHEGLKEENDLRFLFTRWSTWGFRASFTHSVAFGPQTDFLDRLLNRNRRHLCYYLRPELPSLTRLSLFFHSSVLWEEAD